MAVTLQFHPDWPHGGAMVVESMAREGRYRSQFVTGISNGGLTAYPGGDRWRWESRLFDGRYDDAPPEDRPVYGAWNRREDPYGGAVRFGSAYARLRPELLDRTTFCFPDSVLEPEDTGGPEALAYLCTLADASGLDDLDECVEAQVHGPVGFADDVEAVVLDPCFAGTPVEAAARRLGCEVEWHPGFRVATADLDPAYRGAEVVALAQRLGRELTPDVVGAAARSGRHEPQRVKQVWHYLARFGRADLPR
ncbi:DUF3626 domain-containing protein [Nocardioides mangrovicus]|uniref:DUF3626 domain-containing protein n=1 Tax=Nocardioides mangrovicus TaxID=2478913 RepID=A0A3L8NXT9_9ACTN|nr:DUF3626 domain-containing protein [Nocardioides mangrovicus]RLV48036.1 DUF3626 domain-containing protein [Nocardioides mangrovicus]